MEFNEKLQELRKAKGITQEELAELLFVSRAAVSKWESGRGYPNIDSLKAISKLFSVSLDELLSCDEIVSIAEKEKNEDQKYFCDLVFGLLDIGNILLLFLPFFGIKSSSRVETVSLPALNSVSNYLKITFIVFVGAVFVFGILTLALQNFRFFKGRNTVSLILSFIGTFLFIISRQPYAALFTLVFLIIKVFLLIKKK